MINQFELKNILFALLKKIFAELKFRGVEKFLSWNPISTISKYKRLEIFSYFKLKERPPYLVARADTMVLALPQGRPLSPGGTDEWVTEGQVSAEEDEEKHFLQSKKATIQVKNNNYIEWWRMVGESLISSVNVSSLAANSNTFEFILLYSLK